MPSPMVWVLRRRMGFLSLVSPKRRTPVPSTTGKIFSRSSSTRSCSISVYMSWMLPGTTMSPSICCFSAGTSVSTSPLSTVELFQAGWPPRSKPLIAPPTQQERFLAKRLVEGELAKLWVVADQADPAAVPEAFVTGRVLDDSVERNVFAHDDLSHSGITTSLQSLVLATEAGSGSWCCVLGGRPGSKSASARPIAASAAQAAKADW